MEGWLLLADGGVGSDVSVRWVGVHGGDIRVIWPSTSGESSSTSGYGGEWGGGSG